jgi:hypothetical protein
MSIIIMAASSVDGEPDTFLFFLVSDLSVFRDVSEFDKETRVGARNVPNALE